MISISFCVTLTSIFLRSIFGFLPNFKNFYLPKFLWIAEERTLYLEPSISNPIIDLTIISSRANLSYFRTKPGQNAITWLEALDHIRERVLWENNSINIMVNAVEDVVEYDTLPESNVVILIGLTDSSYLTLISKLARSAKAVLVLESNFAYYEKQKFGEFIPSIEYNSISKSIDKNLKSLKYKYSVLYELCVDLWNRRSSGDILFLFLNLINEFSTPVPSVISGTSSDNTGLKQVLNCAK